jgi:redox-sensitive bicupin YhaK (pirin superfamily)
VHALSEILNVAIDLAAEGEVAIDATHAERALYVLEGEAQLDGADVPMRHLLVLDPGRPARLRAKTPLKAMLFGGAPLDGPRHLWWNFVSSSKERIERAKQDWRDGRFGAVPGDHEHIPLPET